MRSLFAVIAAAALASVRAQIDPSACSVQTALEFTFDLTAAAACAKGTVAHQASGGGSNTLTVNVDFPTVNPAGNPAFYAVKPVQYGVYVFDSTQGSDTDADWTFGTNPNIAQLGQSSSTLASTQLLTRSSSGFTGTLGAYLYSTTLTNPSGRYVVKFTTDSSKTTNVKYVVAIKMLDETAGHLAANADTPIGYNFGQTSADKFVSLAGFGGSVFGTAMGYSPGVDARLVQDLVVTAKGPDGIRLNSVSAGTKSNLKSSDYSSLSSNVMKGHIGLPAVVYPTNAGRTAAGLLYTQFSVTLYDTTGSTNVGVDITRSPGPFLAVNMGSSADTFTEAMTLSPGATADITFDAEKVSTDDNRAKLSHKLLKLTMPSKWWAARFTMTGMTSDGVDANKDRDLATLLSVIRAAGVNEIPANSGALGTAFLDDNTVPGAVVLMNNALGTVSGLDPMGSGSTASLTGFKLFDARLATRSVYILLCRSASCATTSSTTAPLRVAAKVKWASISGFEGECDSNADCVSGDKGHPAQTRASAFSANGDVNRFANCLLMTDATGRLPNSRCVECLSDCDCGPGQFCYDVTGVAGNVVVDELSRLRSGICMKKDMNGTILGKQCRRPNSYNTPSAVTGIATTFTAATVPYLVDQPGPNPCGEFVSLNSSLSVGPDGAVSTNISGQVYAALWSGSCDGDGICRECAGGVDGSVATACSNSRVCLDGAYFAARSLDGTVRTLTNDTKAGMLMFLLFLVMFATAIILFMCICQTFCQGKREKREASETANPVVSSKSGAAAGHV
ncbi:hypothetical protein FNF27_05882 [Cafeteria roenbergensis]|uniref:Uncharacterized protein n=1 Tax=Cafeteria roenbergensis TaxID=33653 RepID=A0A5A8E5Q3_CAFRO|nr:hypothetical protein FNF27_05882 [Cafeteria roenbergensis]